MCLICSFVPASIFTTIGYFVLVTAVGQDRPLFGGPSGLSVFGVILAIALFIIALGFIICGLYMTASGKCPMRKFMDKMSESS